MVHLEVVCVVVLSSRCGERYAAGARKRKSARWVTEFYRVFAAPCKSF
jgi:hypothetical protein